MQISEELLKLQKRIPRFVVRELHFTDNVQFSEPKYIVVDVIECRDNQQFELKFVSTYQQELMDDYNLPYWKPIILGYFSDVQAAWNYGIQINLQLDLNEKRPLTYSNNN